MKNRASRRRYRKSGGRRVWVFSELNRELRPEQIARIITSAGLEQARLEADARAQHTDNQRTQVDDSPDAEDDDHA